MHNILLGGKETVSVLVEIKRNYVSRKKTIGKKCVYPKRDWKFISSGAVSCLFVLGESTRFKPRSQWDDVARQLIKRKIIRLYQMRHLSRVHILDIKHRTKPYCSWWPPKVLDVGFSGMMPLWLWHSFIVPRITAGKQHRGKKIKQISLGEPQTRENIWKKIDIYKTEWKIIFCQSFTIHPSRS